MSEAKSFREHMASSTFVHVAFGFFAMGAWAVFANRGHPLEQALLAGLVQGIISGTLTLFMKKGLERMSAMLFRGRNHEGGRNIAALIVPPLVTATVIGTILVTAHTLAGTPEVLATIAVPFTVSTTYAILYNLRLWRAAHGR
jgi:hypothetical protein